MKYLIQHYFEDNFFSKKYLTAIQKDKRAITYEELNHSSQKFAHFLSQTSIKKGELFAILSNVLPETIAMMLGCLKEGVVYVPLNIHAPAAWLANIINKANIKYLLVQDTFLDKALALKNTCGIERIICINTHLSYHSSHPDIISFQSILDQHDPIESHVNLLADDLAYILYTSGSTGDPKGIMITHRNAYTFIGWMKDKFSVNTRDRILSRAPLQFDLSVFDIYSTFYAGATLVIKPNDLNEEPESIIKLIEDEYVTIIYTVPSAYIRLLTKANIQNRMRSLRLALYAGEPFPPNYLNQFMTALPQIQVSNIYGPTETNIVTYHDMTIPPDPIQAIPLGKPAGDTEIVIVDDELNILPPNEIGEILVRGGTVFAGYFNQPELTQKRLIQSPFHQQPSMCCRTGDLGKILADGTIMYHGRMDNMVKTRGYRVEMDEVENAISRIDGISQAAVVAKPHQEFSNTLHAYVLVSNTLLTSDDIMNHLSQLIPKYMLPLTIEIINDMPKTATGKIDRVKLKECA
jgi:amino acid adenylation domain-containing protein